MGNLKSALEALMTDGSGACAWSAIPSLLRLSSQGAEVEIDLRASDVVGVPVVVARAVPRHSVLDRLTDRQKQVALCLAKGLSNRQIADALGISIATTKDHVHAVLKKLQVASRSSVAALAFGFRS